MLEFGEEGEDGNLDEAIGVGIEPVVGFDDDEAFVSGGEDARVALVGLRRVVT